jgi:hypothetical protein
MTTFKTKIRTLLSVLLALVSVACSRGEKPLAVAEWQFIDAETTQPIEGGWINFAWRGKPTDRGMTTCPRGVLGRTGADGWFRTTAKDPSWRVDPIPSYFVPGYQFFEYEYGMPDAQHITTYIPYDVNRLGTMPGFENELIKNGYVYHQPVMSDRWSHHWTKIMPVAGFHDFRNNPQNRRRYFIRYLSFPEFVEQGFSFMGKQCDEEGSDNIGLESKRIQLTDRLRAISSTKYFCGPLWFGMKAGTTRTISSMYEWMQRGLWLLPSGRKPWDEMKVLLPEHVNTTSKEFMADIPLNETEHALFCSWIDPYLKAATLEIENEK